MTTANAYAPPMSDRMTRAEAAAHLGITPGSLDRLIRRGDLTAAKNRYTKRVTLDAAEVERLRLAREEDAVR